MQPYLDLLRRVLERGVPKDDRTGTGTLAVFGEQVRFDLGTGFPLVTTKRMPFASIVHELLWMLAGETNVQSLHACGVHIWDPWAGEHGDLGPIYGAQWRRWPQTRSTSASAVDQLAWVVQEIRRNPHSRRLLVSAWNV